MKQIALVSTGTLLASFGSSWAADATLPPTTWDGWYAGISGGYLSNTVDLDDHNRSDTSDGNYCWSYPCDGSASRDASNVLLGAQLGYNYQSGALVLGAEVDASAVIGGSNDTFTLGDKDYAPPGGDTRLKNELDGLATARLRLGLAAGNFLFYGTGGLAIGLNNTQARVNYDDYTWSDEANLDLGYTIGGGIEAKVSDQVSLKLEGLYYDLGDEEHVSSWYTTNYEQHNHLDIDTSGYLIRAGVNYAF